jgi:hypothetical protein
MRLLEAILGVVVESSVSMWLYKKQGLPPGRGTRRARNWRTIVFGERIVDKHGRLSDWEAVSPPYRRGAWDVLARIDVRCLACGRFYDRFLNDIVQGKSRRCGSCRSAGRKAPRAGDEEPDPGPDARGR